MVEEEQVVLEVVGELSHQISPHHPTPTLMTDLEVELGLGSLERVELVHRLEQRLGRPLQEEPIFRARYVSDLLQRVVAPQELSAPALIPRPLPKPPRHSRNLLEAIAYQAEQQPQAVALALLEQEKEVALPTYTDLLHQARRVSTGLRSLGVKPGEPVAVMLPTGVDFFVAFFGILNAGAIAVPLYPPVRLDQFEDFLNRQKAILQNCRARVLITLPQLALVGTILEQHATLETITSVADLLRSDPEPLWLEAEPDRIALLQYTSGSTGDPKGVPLTHHNLLTNIWAIGQGFAMGDHDVMVSWLPLYHDMGLIGTSLGSFAHGLPLVLMGPEQFLSRPARWLRAFSRYRGTMTAAPNFAYAVCASKVKDEELEGLDLSCWRIALNGAEPIVAGTLEAFCERFAGCGFRRQSMFPAYGLAEATLAVTFNPLGRGPRILHIDRRELAATGRVIDGPDPIVSCGRVLEGVQVRIADDSGPLPERHQGSVELKGDSVMRGYYGHPSAGEWLRVGDLGFMEGGELFITGRNQDLIVVGGRNLHPSDLEAAVGMLDGVRAGCVAVIGIESEGTQRLVVLAETRKATAQMELEIKRRVQEVAALPAQVHLLPPRTLPKTPSGKIRRQESKRRLLEGALRPPKVEARSIARAGRAWLGKLPERIKEAARGAWCAGWLSVAWFELVALERNTGPVLKRLLERLGVRLEITGCPPPAAPVMLVANHGSLLDGLLLSAVWPRREQLRFLIAESTAAHPLVSPLARGHLRVKRGLGLARQALDQMREALEQSQAVAVFPEGGIERSVGIRGFATGPFQAAALAGAPLQPVAIEGSRAVLPQGSLVIQPGAVKFTFLEPILPESSSFDQATILARRCREAIASHLDEPLTESRLARRD